jgi:hypothetical protein
MAAKESAAVANPTETEPVGTATATEVAATATAISGTVESDAALLREGSNTTGDGGADKHDAVMPTDATEDKGKGSEE